MEFQLQEAVEFIQALAENENLTLEDAFMVFVTEAELDTQTASILKGSLFEKYSLDEMVSDSVTKAMFNVFVAGYEKPDLQEMDTKESQEGTKYKVRVKDKNSGSSYVRYATRAKIAELRANPNIASVELTDYGAVGADNDGQKTAAAKRGKDYDGDGKVESSSKEHAGVVHNAIQRKKGGVPDGQDTRKETRSESYDFLSEGDTVDAGRKNEGQRKNKKITGEAVDNSTSVVLMPQIDEELVMEKAKSKSQQKLFGMVRAAQKGEGAASEKVAKLASSMKKSDVKDFASTKHKGLPEGMGFEGTLLAEAYEAELDLDEVIEEIMYEMISEGYTAEEVEEAIDECLFEAKVTYGHDTEAPKESKPASGAKSPSKLQGRMRFLKRKVGEKLAKATDKAKEKVSKAKEKVGGAVSKAKEKAKAHVDYVRTGPKGDSVASRVSKAKEGAKAAGERAKHKLSDAKDKAKSGIKAKIKKAADKVSARMAEEASLKLDQYGMPIMEYSKNNAVGPGSLKTPVKDSEGAAGVKNPKGVAKKTHGGDRRPGVGPGAGV